MNCWGIRIYFTKSRFSLNGGYIVYMELLSENEKIITKPGTSLNAGILNRGFIVFNNKLANKIIHTQAFASSNGKKSLKHVTSTDRDNHG
jgi:hypothetical protein